MTSQKIAFGLVAVALFVGSMTAHAADFSEGVKAYERGDYVTAIRIMRQFAAQGYAKAQYNLGAMYGKGEGVPQDYKEAVKWYRKAAAQGYAAAQSDLGNMYYKGQGVTQDYVQAHMWYNIAAPRGQKIAKKNRDLLAEQMTPEQITEAKRRARVWKRKRR